MQDERHSGGIGQFFRDNLVVAEIAAPRAAVCFIRPRAKEPVGAGLLPDFFGGDAVAFPSVVVRRDFVLHELAKAFAEHLVFQLKMTALHHASLGLHPTRRAARKPSISPAEYPASSRIS